MIISASYFLHITSSGINRITELVVDISKPDYDGGILEVISEHELLSLLARFTEAQM